MKNGNRPAMPIIGDTKNFADFLDGIKGGRNYGLTKREEFAKAAMQGLVVTDKFDYEQGTINKMAEWSVECADALLAALEKSQ